MNEIFTLKESTRYPSKQIFTTSNVRTVTYGTNTISHIGPKIWFILPDDIKGAISLQIFKKENKTMEAFGVSL